MRVVFLDVDGVLNHSTFLIKVQEAWDARKERRMCDWEMLDEAAVKLVNQICVEGKAQIVLSSTWRLITPLGTMNRWLRDKGLTVPVFDKTAYGNGCPRGYEIQHWLDENRDREWDDGTKGIESFVILDDDSDMVHLMPRLVQTHFSGGLMEEHVPMAIAKLNRPCAMDSKKRRRHGKKRR